MSTWYCAQCGKESSYQGHTNALGEFTCSSVPVEGSANYKDKKLLEIRSAAMRGDCYRVVQLIDEFRLTI